MAIVIRAFLDPERAGYVLAIEPTPTQLPLYVDLDGTLIRGDTTQQASLALLRQNPLALLRAALKLTQGRAASKDVIAANVALDAAHFPYRPEVVEYVRRAKAAGRRVVLATGTHLRYARAVDAHFPGLFDAVYATENGVNLTSTNKLAAIVRDGGERFEYMGDSHADLKIFEKAVICGWVGVKRITVTAGDGRCVYRLCADPINRPAAVLRLLRPHQWTKNLLVLLPLLTAHRWHDGAAWARILLATAALCLVASACYVFNDALDVDADQRHPAKRHRPLASGDVSLVFGGALFLSLSGAGLALAACVNRQTLGLVAAYLTLNLAYTLALKRRLLVDVVTLAALYAIRPVIGGHATGVVLSEWLTTFCAFFFASLSFLKRFTELKPHADAGSAVGLPGRGYQPQDLPVVQSTGLICGVAAVLVMAFYVNSPAVTVLYERPAYLWAWCPLIGYWVVRAWMLAGRGTLHHDPVVFAFTDTRSYGVIAAMLIAGLLAGAKLTS